MYEYSYRQRGGYVDECGMQTNKWMNKTQANFWNGKVGFVQWHVLKKKKRIKFTMAFMQGNILINESIFKNGSVFLLANRLIFVIASHQTGLDTRSMTQRSIIVGMWGEGQALALARTLLDCADHRPTLYNVGLMNLAGFGPKSGSRHVCLIIA